MVGGMKWMLIAYCTVVAIENLVLTLAKDPDPGGGGPGDGGGAGWCRVVP